MAMLVSKTDGNRFYENPSLTSTKGVRKVGRLWLNLKDIRVEPVDNVVRFGGTDSKLVEELKFSFRSSIRYNEFLPIVKKLAVNKPGLDGDVKFYELVDGYNRITALQDLGYTHYWFDVADFGHDGVDSVLAQTSLAITMNAPVPKVSSSDKDLFNAVTNLVDKGLIENDFIKIKQYIRDTAKLTPARADKIANQVAKASGAPNIIYIWTGKMIKKDVGTLGIKSEGKYDSSRGKHGWTSLEGYETEAVFNTLNKLRDTGETSYIVGHTKLPDDNNDLKDRRHNVLKNIEDRRKSLLAFVEYYNKYGRLPFDFIGFLPQDQNEDRTKLVQIK